MSPLFFYIPLLIFILILLSDLYAIFIKNGQNLSLKQEFRRIASENNMDYEEVSKDDSINKKFNLRSLGRSAKILNLYNLTCYSDSLTSISACDCCCRNGNNRIKFSYFRKNIYITLIRLEYKNIFIPKCAIKKYSENSLLGKIYKMLVLKFNNSGRQIFYKNFIIETEPEFVETIKRLIREEAYGAGDYIQALFKLKGVTFSNIELEENSIYCITNDTLIPSQRQKVINTCKDLMSQIIDEAKKIDPYKLRNINKPVKPAYLSHDHKTS